MASKIISEAHVSALNYYSAIAKDAGDQALKDAYSVFMFQKVYFPKHNS